MLAIHMGKDLQETTVIASGSDASPAERLLVWVDRWRFVLAVGVVLIYLAGFNGQWRIGDDSASYVNIASAMRTGGGLGDHDESMHRYPGTPLIIAAAFTIGGDEAFWLADAFFLALALATLLLVYRTLALHDGRPAAVLVTCMLALTAHFHEHAYELLADLPFLFGVMLFLCGYEGLLTRRSASERRWPSIALHFAALLAGLGVMLLTRRTMLVFVAAFIGVCAWQLVARGNRTQRAMLGGTVVAVLAATGLWIAFDPRGGPSVYARDLMLHRFTQDEISEMLARFAGYFARIFEGDAAEAAFGLDLGPGLSTLAGAAVLTLGIALARRRLLWGAFIAALFVAMVVHMPDVRYFLAVMPLLAYGWWRGAAALSRKVKPQHATLALGVMLGLWFVPNLVGVGKTIVEQRRTPFLEHYKDGNILALRTMSERVRDALGEEDVVLTDSPAIVRHFSGRRAANAKLLHRWSRLDASWIATMRSEPQRVFVIAPMRDELSERLRDQLGLELSQTIAEVARGEGTPLTLHTVRRLDDGVR